VGVAKEERMEEERKGEEEGEKKVKNKKAEEEEERNEEGKESQWPLMTKMKHHLLDLNMTCPVGVNT